VKIPMMFMSSSQIAVMPKFLRVISSSASRRWPAGRRAGFHHRYA
jgi:hypothetical protein